MYGAWRAVALVHRDCPPLCQKFFHVVAARSHNPVISSISGSSVEGNFAVGYAHSLGLGRSAAGDLLDAELVQLGLQLLELLGELILVLAPELTSLDLGRLRK